MKPNPIELAIEKSKNARAHISAALLLGMDVDKHLLNIIKELDSIIDRLDSVNQENKTKVVD